MLPAFVRGLVAKADSLFVGRCAQAVSHTAEIASLRSRCRILETLKPGSAVFNKTSAASAALVR